MDAPPVHSISSGHNLTTAGNGGLLTKTIQVMATTDAGRIFSFVIATLIAVLLLDRLVSPLIDSEEPTVTKSPVPLVGHIFGLLFRQSRYFASLHKKQPLPITTLPMLNGKIYLATDPVLIQAALKNKNLTFDNFSIDFVQKLMDVKPSTIDTIRNLRQDPELGNPAHAAIRDGLSGESLHAMNLKVLAGFADGINEIPPGPEGLQVSNFWLWLRDLGTVAMTNGLFGKENDPFEQDPSLVDDMWLLDAHIPGLALSPAPSLTHARIIAARNRMQERFGAYFAAGHDMGPGASDLIRKHAGAHRRAGIPVSEIGKMDLLLVLPAVQNALPTLLWFILNVFRRPEFVRRIRDEVLPLLTLRDIVGRDKEESEEESKIAEVDISVLEDGAPFLNACYKEAIRVGNAQQGIRRVLEDTYLTDGQGRRWLLKKGVDLMMPAAITHRMPGVWEGPEEAAFNPNNFLSPENRGLDPKTQAENERRRRLAYIPFGGGKHYCPGRKIALYENLALVAALVIGFELEATTEGVTEVWTDMKPLKFGEAVCKPEKNGAELLTRLRRREGWEHVTWKFIC